MNTSVQKVESDVWDLLPWYVNGTLENEGRARVERIAENSTEIRAELLWLCDLSIKLTDGIASNAPGEIKTDAIKFDTGKSLACVLAMTRAGRIGRLLPFKLGMKWPDSRYKAAFAIAASLLVAQSVVLFSFANWPNPSMPASLAPLGSMETFGGAGKSLLLQVTFRPAAQEAQIRKILNSTHAEIVGGPGALGVYTIAVPADGAALAGKQLMDQKSVVEKVSSLNAMQNYGLD
ncbi:MAG: hypothetical protein ABI905_13465 [Betaproteobacteria bacterium]